jgi:tetratricopeptide (TPR) repeat protein
LAIEPVSPYFNILRAMTYELLGRYKDAIIDCTAALKVFTDDDQKEMVMLYTVRGRCFGMIVEFGRALTDFNKLIELKPQDDRAYFYRGVIYANCEELGKAIADFRKSLQLKPGDANVSDSLAKAEKEQAAYKMQERLKKKAKPAGGVLTKVRNQTEELESEINQLRGEVKILKELVLEITRHKPEYSIPLPLPEVGIFRMPVRPSIIMPVPEVIKQNRDNLEK